jgi:hypothetical protein
VSLFDIRILITPLVSPNSSSKNHVISINSKEILRQAQGVTLAELLLQTQGVILAELLTQERYQRGNQNPYIEEGQTTQSLKEKVQKDKQRSTKHTYNTVWVPVRHN